MSGTGEPQAPKNEDADCWGYLFNADRSPTPKLDEFLRGLAVVISEKFEPDGSLDLTPTQLSAFYRSVGGNYDALFLQTPPSKIAYIYKSLGCLHSLQPDLRHSTSLSEEAHSAPSVPALKPSGFVTWQTIQLLLGPQEHVPFMQDALRKFDITNPVDRQSFPKNLPAESFPKEPDPQMVAWHDAVAQRLRKEAERCLVQDGASPDNSPEPRSPPAPIRGSHRRSITENAHVEFSEQTRPGMYRRSSHPSTKNIDGAPAIVRQFAQVAPEKVKQGGKSVAITMKNIASPHLWSNGKHNGSRRRSSHHTSDDDGSADESRVGRHRRGTSGSSPARHTVPHSRPSPGSSQHTSPPHRHPPDGLYPERPTARSRTARPKPREYSTSPTDSSYDRSPARYPVSSNSHPRTGPSERGPKEREYLRTRDNSRHRYASRSGSRGRAEYPQRDRDHDHPYEPRSAPGPIPIRGHPPRSKSPSAMAHWSPYGSPPRTSASASHLDTAIKDRDRDRRPGSGPRTSSYRSALNTTAQSAGGPTSVPASAPPDAPRVIPRLTRTMPSHDRTDSFESDAARKSSETGAPGFRYDGHDSARERSSRGSHGHSSGGDISPRSGGMSDHARDLRRDDDAATPRPPTDSDVGVQRRSSMAARPPPSSSSGRPVSPPIPRVNGVGGRRYPDGASWR